MKATTSGERIPARSSTSQTPDETIRQAALDRLSASGYLLLRRLQCEVTDGQVTVYGSVPTFYLKQVAQSVLVKVESVRGVRNLIEVRDAQEVLANPSSDETLD